MVEDTENIEEPADFAAYKLRALVREAVANGEIDKAHAIQDALDSYLLGELVIGFYRGKPFNGETRESVSYTHLTLPTIYSV